MAVVDGELRYGNRVIWENLNFEAQSGTHTALIGASGSGKTSLLSVLGNLHRLTKGTVSLYAPDGTSVAIRESVSWVLQGSNCFARRSVYSNVLMGSITGSGSDSHRRQDAINAIEAVGLEHLGQTAARKLSGGELQRMSIARAIVANRPFILADEPTGQLDRVTTDRVLDALFTAAVDRGLLIATHDPRVWERCGRVVDVAKLGGR